jgi:hypothetical protein
MTLRDGVRIVAANGKIGLTLGELRVLVQNAMRLDMSDNAIVKHEPSWSGKLVGLKIEEVPEESNG